MKSTKQIFNQKLEAGSSFILSVVFSSDGNYLVSGSANFSIVLC